MNGSLRDQARGFALFIAFCAGRVPNHAFRLFVYRRLGMRVGKRSSVHWRAAFFAPWGISIGDHSVIGTDAFLDGRSSLTVGDNVNIGGDVQIFTLEHDPQARDFGTKGGPVIIEDRAYVGSRVTILPGIRIGEGAVVASGAVVTKDVAPFTIVGGVPARQIGERTRDLDYELDHRSPFQ